MNDKQKAAIKSLEKALSRVSKSGLRIIAEDDSLYWVIADSNLKKMSPWDILRDKNCKKDIIRQGCLLDSGGS